VGVLNGYETFKLIKENKIWLGYGFKGGAAHFINKYYEDYATAGNHVDGMIRVSGVVWFTNLDISKRHEDLILYKSYNKDEYPKYYNYNAINIDKTKDIPVDYNGEMGVPITFLNKFNPEQFELIGLANDKREIDSAFIQGKITYLDDKHKKFVGMVLKEGNKLRATYARIIIRNKRL